MIKVDMMELGRKAIFALIAAAVMLNIGYGLLNNGIPSPFRGSIGPDGTFQDLTEEFVVPPLTEGSIYRSSYNMTVAVQPEKKEDGQSGSYHLEGTSTRMVLDNRLIRELEGPYVLSYRFNETEDLTINGHLDRTRDTSVSDDGMPLREKVSTFVSVTGPKGFGSSSSIETELEEISSVRSDLVWTELLPGDGILKEGMNGSLRTDLDLQEAGLSLDTLDLKWEVVSIFQVTEGRRAIIEMSSPAGRSGSVDIRLVMLESTSWPDRMELSIKGTFDTDEGPTRVEMDLKEELLESTHGGGREFTFEIFSPMGPPYTGGVHPGYPELPEEEEDTGFRSSPREILEFYHGQGGIVDGMVRKYGWDGITAVDLTYSRNDTVDLMWTWNITLAAPPVNGLSETVTFEVGVEGGGLLDQKRYTLISESGGLGSIYPDPERSMATLDDNEQVLLSSRFSEMFFRSDGYAASFGFDVIRRDTNCCSVGSILFMNMLGVEKSSVNDIFISSVLDRTDRSRMYLVVVDGGDGSLISTTELEGASVTLFKAYGFDLA